jgi:hypothetical protein
MSSPPSASHGVHFVVELHREPRAAPISLDLFLWELFSHAHAPFNEMWAVLFCRPLSFVLDDTVSDCVRRAITGLVRTPSVPRLERAASLISPKFICGRDRVSRPSSSSPIMKPITSHHIVQRS